MVNISGKGNGRRGLSFDLNLVPFIDVLSTCICFLLITAVFMQLGTMDVRQALGDGAASASKKNEPTVWLKLEDDGSIHVTVKNVPSSQASDFLVKGISQSPDWPRFESSMQVVKTTYPKLATALVLPAGHSKYSDVIRAMDLVKKGAIPQVGIAPL